jgi:hypothetical protein
LQIQKISETQDKLILATNIDQPMLGRKLRNTCLHLFIQLDKVDDTKEHLKCWCRGTAFKDVILYWNKEVKDLELWVDSENNSETIQKIFQELTPKLNPIDWVKGIFRRD